ncbi:hypothetical protein FNV43_RR02580 [Rhamnella rubrinervis]|uniref:Uncharacterized protein n=1 Tax=Rhamnella rubrinervis TaxID=2594499 RepID=A0A8K0HTV4_9ROSA|nr:hypothetical protein FNV43_RR02580 [Rhamnella rubrinervis]
MAQLLAITGFSKTKGSQHKQHRINLCLGKRPHIGVVDIPLPLNKLALALIDHEAKDKRYVVLVATGSFNPPAFMHLCLFGELHDRDRLLSKP